MRRKAYRWIAVAIGIADRARVVEVVAAESVVVAGVVGVTTDAAEGMVVTVVATADANNSKQITP
jgi:hypothetical protein